MKGGKGEMKEKIILAITVSCLSMFGFRSFLPAISSLALVGLFTIAGLIGCCYHLYHSKYKRRIGTLAMSNGWLSSVEVKQILYCQKDCGSKFGEVAVRRNYLTLQQVASILEVQPSIA
jgi:hypothetical protein